MPHYFYFARCSDRSLYAGYTTDPKKREQAHNLGKGAKYTAGRKPVKIIYSEKFTTKSEALRREAGVKKWRKAEKENLIARQKAKIKRK